MWTLGNDGNWVLANKESMTEITFIIVAEDFCDMMEKLMNAMIKKIIPDLDYTFADNGNGTWTIYGAHMVTIVPKV